MHVHSSIIYNSQNWKQAKCSSKNGQTKCGVYTQWNIIQPLKRIFQNTAIT